MEKVMACTKGGRNTITDRKDKKAQKVGIKNGHTI